MKKINNAKMTEEELDQVAGGQKTATFERLADGRIKYTKFTDERTVSADGGQSSFHAESEKVIQPKFLEKAIEKAKKEGFEIVLKGF